MNILVIAAHPDDEVLGCGGTLARYAAEGNDVFIAILGQGVTSRYECADGAEAELRALHDCCRKAAEILGAREPLFFNLPDNQFDTVPLLSVVKKIEETMNRIRPHVVFTQHGGDLNIDHALTFRATLTACRPMAGATVRALYAYEVPSSTEWSFQKFDPPFRPGHFINVSSTMEKKQLAMKAYTAEARSFPHPRSPEAIRAIARRWGSVVGVEYAEAFDPVWSIR